VDTDDPDVTVGFTMNSEDSFELTEEEREELEEAFGCEFETSSVAEE